MRRLSWLVAVLLGTGALAFAQGIPDPPAPPPGYDPGPVVNGDFEGAWGGPEQIEGWYCYISGEPMVTTVGVGGSQNHYAVLEAPGWQRVWDPEGGEMWIPAPARVSIEQVIDVPQDALHLSFVYQFSTDWWWESAYAGFNPYYLLSRCAWTRYVAPIDPQLRGTRAALAFWVEDPGGGGYGRLALDQVSISSRGSSGSAPLLPATVEPGAGGAPPTWHFDPVSVGNNGPGAMTPTPWPVWFDPPLAIGYEYHVTGNMFGGVILPDGIGDGHFRLLLFDADQDTYVDSGADLTGGVLFDLTSLVLGGVDTFRIMGIEPSAGIDPADPQGFPTGLTFAAPGLDTAVTMTSIVPEPATLSLLALGGLAALRRRRR